MGYIVAIFLLFLSCRVVADAAGYSDRLLPSRALMIIWIALVLVAVAYFVASCQGKLAF